MLVGGVLVFFGFLIAVLTKDKVAEEITEFRKIIISLLFVLVVVLSFTNVPFSLPILILLALYKKEKIFPYLCLASAILFAAVFSSDAVFITSLSISILSGWLSDINFSKAIFKNECDRSYKE